jgi:hypothetical protein
MLGTQLRTNEAVTGQPKLRICRKLDNKRRSLTKLALDLDASPVCQRKLARDGQPQSSTCSLSAGARRIGTPEAVKDEGEILGSNALAGITHDEANEARHAFSL